MPRKGKGRRGGKAAANSFVWRGRLPYSSIITNGHTSALVQVSAGNLLPGLAQVFKFYKVERLRLNCDPVVRFETTVPSTSAAGRFAVAYYPDSLSGTTGLTIGDVVTIPDCVTGTAQVVNSNITNNSTLLQAGQELSWSLAIRSRGA